MHPLLVSVAVRALELSPVDFTVIEGLRTEERQAKLVQEGVSWTMHSMHLLQPSGFAHALDWWPYGAAASDVNWMHVGSAFLRAAEQLGVQVAWGGDWNSDGKLDWGKFDGRHIQLKRGVY